MTHNWEQWDHPSTAEQLQFSMLARLQGSTNQCIYMRVYETSDETLGDDSGMIIVLNFADVEAKIRTNRDADFVMAVDDKRRWGFRTEPIGGPDSLEKLVEMLKSVSTPTLTYQIYTNGQQAAIGRELIVEPEKQLITAATNQELVCHGEVPHIFGREHFLVTDGGRCPSLQFQICTRCGSPICINMVR